ncbi:MAG: DNA primase [Bacillota bacterium]
MAHDESVDRVRELSDLAEIVSEYVTLRKRGSNLVGLCPFHEERTPSFTVSPDRQLFYCFGCGAGGDVFNFIMMIEGMTFPEALRYLAERAGVELSSGGESREEASRSRKMRDYLLRVAEFAANRFESNLAGKEGKAARDYLASRKVDTQLAGEYRLGFAESGWSSLTDVLKREGFSLKAAEVLGLVRRSRGGRYYDLMRNRLIFPITDIQSRVIAFAGRTLADEEPKYLNSPESPVFAKGDVWYGLDAARESIRRRDRAIIVEGYMDVLACAREGWQETVAAMGTAVTANQARILARYTRTALTAFDGDEAGIRAALRSYASFASCGVDLRVMEFEAGRDPADVLSAEDGSDMFSRVVANATDFFEFAWEHAKESVDLRSSRGKADAVEMMVEIIAAEEDPIVGGDQIRRIAQDLRVSEEAVRAGLKRARRQHRRPRTGDSGETAERPSISEGEADVGGGQMKAERAVVSMMLRHPEYLARGRECLQPEDFRSRLYAALAGDILESDDVEDPHRMAGIMIGRGDEEMKAELARIMMEESDASSDDRVFEDCVVLLKKRSVEGKLEKLRRQVADLQRRGEPIPPELLREQADLLAELKGSIDPWRSKRGQRE